MSRFRSLFDFDLVSGLPLETDTSEEAAREASSASGESHDAKQDLPLGSSPETQEKPLQEADEEARGLAERLRRLLEPETLEKLKLRAPLQVSRWEKVTGPEKFLRRTLNELEGGRSWVLTAAKERARRFLEAIKAKGRPTMSGP